MMMATMEESSLPADARTLLAGKGGNDMTPASLEGQTLGRYRVLEPLGRGGMARVYRGYHPQLNRYVAIKVLRSDLVEDEDFLTRFRREAQAVAALRHSNVVQVFDFDVHGDVYYMVMELMEGDTLKTRLNDYRVRDERMAWGEAVRVLLDVLDGLAYAHSEGMVHRDIKPANILLTRRGQAVIADFGIAQIVGGTRHTAAGALMGTLHYMAPEQGLEGHSDVRSDVYSLGIVFYEMLTRRTPYDADTPLAVLMKHLNDPLPLPRQIEPGIPEPFERVVLKALAKDADDRYQSAEEMAQALHEAVQDAGIELPDRIPLPLSFKTDEVPSESVAVLSGTARERITDVHFADDETDAALSQRLGVSRLVELRRAGKAKESQQAKADQVHPKAAERARRAAAKRKRRDSAETVTERVRRAVSRPEGRQVALAILYVIGIAAAGNLVMLAMTLPTGNWVIYERGWPIELFLVSLGLCVTMHATSSIWLLLPTGIILGTGVTFAYSSVTGNWHHWTYLWLFEVWVVAGSVVISVLLARREEFASKVSRPIAWLLGLASVLLIATNAAGATIASWFTP